MASDAHSDVLRILTEGTAAAVGDDFFRSLARHAAIAMKARYAFVAESLSPDESRSLAYWEGSDFGAGFSYRFPGTPCQRVVAGQVCSTRTGLQNVYPEDRWLVDIGADSYVGVPMVSETGRVIGHIAVLHTEPMQPGADDIAILKIFAARACAELQRRQAEQRERAILEINGAILSERTHGTLLTALAGALRPLLAFDRIALTVEDGDADSLRIVALSGAAPTSSFKAGSRIGRRNSHVGWVAERRQPLLRKDLASERQFTAEHQLFDEGVNSMCTAPLCLAGECVGTLTVGSTSDHRYDAADLDLLQKVCNQVTPAVANMRAFEEIASLKTRLQAENLYLQEEIRAEHHFAEIVGTHHALVDLLQQVERVAPTDSTVLIAGETGTGKELVARALHMRGPRSERPLVKVNCGAISAGLVESELFGHVKGAFTGALQRRVGRFELADGGTLFLDEVGELPLDTQVKLLRVLQEQEFEPVGSSETRRVDVRVVAATNRNLEDAVKEGRFRADLFYRLNVIPLRVPPLRDRREDIPQLAAFFLDRCARKAGRTITGIAPSTLQRLVQYHWPGNVRELQNVIERGVVLSIGPVLQLDEGVFALPPRPAPAAAVATSVEAVPAASSSPPTSMQDVERHHVLAVLERCGWVIEGPEGAAKLLNLNPSTLRSRLRKLGIERQVVR